MVQKCAIAGCVTSAKGRSAKVSLFSCPKNVELRTKWVDVVRSAWLRLFPNEEFTLNENFCVCELHFRDADLIQKWTAVDSAGKVIHEVHRF